MKIVKSLNLGLRFVLELCLLASLFTASINLINNPILRWTAAIGLPVLAASIWGIFVAPKSQHILDQPYRLVVELILFGLASFMLYRAGYPKIAIVFIGVVIINEILLLIWKQ